MAKAPGPGHNNPPADGEAQTVAHARLKGFIERIENLEAEKAELAGDVRETYAEAKAAGFDTKIMRQVIRRRKMEAAERREQDELLALYEKVFA